MKVFFHAFCLAVGLSVSVAAQTPALSPGSPVGTSAVSQPDSVMVLKGESIFGALAFGADGHVLGALDDHSIHVWDPHTGAEIPFAAQGEDLRAFDFDPHGGRAVYSSFRISSIGRGYAFLYDPASGDYKLLGTSDPTPCLDVAFSPDGAHIVTTHASTALVWDAVTGDSLLTLKGNDISLARFSPDGGRIATSGGDTLLRIWSASSGDSVGGFALLKTHPNSIRFSPDGRRILTASDSAARVWDAVSGALLLTLPHDAIVTHAEYSGDGTMIITSSFDHVARIWDAATGALSRSLVGHTAEVLAASFSPDGTLAATTGSDRTVRVWKLVTNSSGVRDMATGEGDALSCFPNPVRDQLQVDYRVTRGGYVRLGLIDVMGREVAVIVDGDRAAGAYSQMISTAGLPSGVYFCVLDGGGRMVTPIRVE